MFSTKTAKIGVSQKSFRKVFEPHVPVLEVVQVHYNASEVFVQQHYNSLSMFVESNSCTKCHET